MKKKPNILYIMADDQGAWAMNCSGTPELYTPNLNRIAESGMRFTQFYCASPVCSPARASLLTGMTPSSHGVHDWLRSGSVDAERFAKQGAENPYGGYRDERIPIGYLDGFTTYTDILKQGGYTCALSGKWHLGDSVRPQHGFEKWYTIGKGGCFYYHPDIVEEGDIHVEHGKYVTELFTDQALRFLDELSGKEDPFYLAVHYTAPHSPWGAEHHPTKWIDYYENCEFKSIPDVPDHPDLLTGPVFGTDARKENLRGYFAAISAMDEQIGRILDALEKNGLTEDTIVIFTADNGMSMGHHGVWGKGNGTFPLNMYDSAIQVPFLISWPGVIKAGSVCQEPVSACDLYPTILEFAGMSEQCQDGLPGKSFLSILNGKNEEDREFVTIYGEYGPVHMIRTAEWKYVHRYPYGKHELFHLLEDPGETTNLYGEPEYEETILGLKGRMEKWFQEYTNPELDGTKEGVTGSGQLCRAGIYAVRTDGYAPVGT